MWERMFDLVLGLKKEHRLMIVITLIYAVTLFGITVDVEAMENWLQLVGYTIRTLCIACIIQLSVFFLTNIFWKELNRGLNKTFVVISGNVLSLAFLLFPFSISYIDMTAESMKLSSLNTERNRIDSMVRYYENLKSLDSSFSENLDSLILEEKKKRRNLYDETETLCAAAGVGNDRLICGRGRGGCLCRCAGRQLVRRRRQPRR